MSDNDAYIKKNMRKIGSEEHEELYNMFNDALINRNVKTTSMFKRLNPSGRWFNSQRFASGNKGFSLGDCTDGKNLEKICLLFNAKSRSRVTTAKWLINLLERKDYSEDQFITICLQLGASWDDYMTDEMMEQFRLNLIECLNIFIFYQELEC